MRKQNILISIALILFGISLVLSQSYTTYTVKAGDTLWNIVKGDNELLKQVQQLNGIQGGDIQVGQKIKIPVKGSVTQGQGYTIYVVKAGDTLWNIVKGDNALLKKVQELNGIVGGDIKVGQQLKIPNGDATPTPQPTNQGYTIYTVKAGDTLWNIVKGDNALLKKVQELNGIVGGDIKVGQQLKIPNGNATPTPQPTNKGYTIYIVKAGDTLWNIVKQDNALLKKVQELNGIVGGDIKVGQQLKIPNGDATPTPKPAEKNYTIYIVKAGDTLWNIVKQDNVLLKKVQELNGIVGSDIKVGQQLKIPKGDATPTPKPAEKDYTIYIVKAGDTLWNIVKQDNVLLKKVQELNGIVGSDIKVGQQLKIPKGDATPTPKPTNQGYTIYTVKAGDTLWNIVKQDNALLKKVQELNGIVGSDIKVGQQLKIPNGDATPTPQPTNKGYTIYIVKAGDTLWNIVKQDNALLKKVQELNGIVGGDIKVGQQLKIPNGDATPTPKPAEKDYTIYIVKAGDTLWNIVKQDNVLLKKVQELNGIVGGDIKVGQKLKIPNKQVTPTPEPAQKDYTLYTVQQGDTFCTIMKLVYYDTDYLKKIQELNGIVGGYIKVGQKLKIPTTEEFDTYVVKSGDSLWNIVKGDRELLKRVEQLNGITGGQIEISPNPQYFENTLTKAQYEKLFPQRNSLYTYESLIKAAKSFYGFADSFNELVVFLTTISFEGDYLKATHEYNYVENTKKYGYDVGFHGRGPIQLTQKVNYKLFSEEVYRDDRFVQNPDLVISDGFYAFQAAIWYWMREVKRYFPKNDLNEALNIATTNGIRPAAPHLENRRLRMQEIVAQIKA